MFMEKRLGIMVWGGRNKPPPPEWLWQIPELPDKADMDLFILTCG